MSCNKPLIEFDNVTKTYHSYSQPFKRLLQMLPWRKNRSCGNFTAINGVSFSLKRGECLGIIGRNGAGKSTLLQLLCGNTDADKGEIKVNGKISALLELGFGFNPEFNGIDNVILAGLMHGLSKKEITSRLNSIVDFADIGEFINKPVKTYSSGMFVRLAFAVAAHVDSEILLIDEALAVGDIFFQQKCSRYLENQRKNKAIILVSHDMSAVSTLCDKVMVLEKGEAVFYGDVRNGIEKYTHLIYSGNNGDPDPETTVSKNFADSTMIPVPQEKCTVNDCIITAYKLESSGKEINFIHDGDQISFAFEFIADKEITHPIIGYFFTDKFGKRIFGNCINSNFPLSAGVHTASFSFHWPPVSPQEYTMTIGIGDGEDAVTQKVCCWATDFRTVNAALNSGISHGIFNVSMENFQID